MIAQKRSREAQPVTNPPLETGAHCNIHIQPFSQLFHIWEKTAKTVPTDPAEKVNRMKHSGIETSGPCCEEVKWPQMMVTML